MRSVAPVASLFAFVLAGLALLGVPDARAQYFGQNKVQYDQFDFRTLETEHFVFHFYPEEEQAVRDAARMAERWYDRHTEVFLHRFDEKKPIIFYANDADFQQTNVTPQPIGQGTGGLTEPLRERVVMPFASSYGETDHVLGHELVHSFQFDLGLNADSLGIQLGNLPTWLIEGMAEYLSVGRQDSHTAMWMRDAVRRDDMPSFEGLANPREYFPYRYGQAYLAYIGGKYGDQAVTDLFKRGGQVGLDSAYVELFGVSADSLTNEWAEATRETYEPLMKGRTPPDSAGQTVLAPKTNGGRINIAPSLSPDGRYVAFISERELFSFNLYVADAETGEVIAELDRAGTTGHFNALRFISSSGTWSPDGRRLAFVSSEDGDNQITVWNVVDEEIERSFSVDGVTSMKNPAWSPDGTRLAFAGTDGGISDLYVLDLETESVRQLTNDRYADLQPTWAPDGETIAFATDRAETNLETLSPSSNMDLGLVDVSSGEVTVRAPFGDALHHNPQFAPDGQSLYFISDQDGFKDVYRMDLSSGDRFRVTRLKTGVSGITALSPALSIASQSGDMMLSVFADGNYTGVRRPAPEAQGTPLRAASTAGGASAARVPAAADTTTDEAGTQSADTSRVAGLLPSPAAARDGLIASNLRDATTGLPPDSTHYDADPYDPTLSLESISRASGIGVSVGGPFGGGLAGGIGLRFGDMLGHRTLGVAVQAQGTFRDIGGGVSYMNQRGQLNWGGSLSHTPLIFSANTVPFRNDAGRLVGLGSVVQRAYITSASGNASYPLSPTRRFEFSLGGTRYGFGTNVRTAGLAPDGAEQALQNQFGDRTPKYLATASAAYVRDFTTNGLTGPLQGGRWRLEVSPTLGSQNFVTARADVRRYFYAEPFTFAFQALHVGNYGASFSDEFGIGNEYIGYPYGQGFVRGYSVQSIANGIRENGGCTRVDNAPTTSPCAEIDRLFGTRALTTRAEIRIPLLGPERLSLIPFRYLPTTLAPFVDAGVTWTNDAGPDLFTFDTDSADTTIPVVSAGVSARFNILGSLLLEAYYARPFQRRDTTWELGFRISPGF
ncbi:DPP IV N-terminal domain-containing protein [Salinibacter ruber]|uniref:DPP IV N-terminal domain-containing protein n=1 Tax=Salinibacter ruber TaxID=146919 RepID=UPI001F07ACE8|nr:basic secretory protein-like protein [Salinibacter ruber]